MKNFLVVRQQAAENQANERLRFKQYQYAQRTSDHIKTRRFNEQKSTELSVRILEVT